ncbi:MAG: hypothetical protein WA919_10630 [Coleofasciculaceae cyanobacterium]
MNLSWTHVHLILNHFPIVGAIFGLLLLIYALIKHSEDLKQASYWTFIIIALITIPVFYAGTQAATVIHNFPDVSDSLIHKHREVAEQALIALEILGAMSLVGLFLFRDAKKTPIWFTTTLLVVTVIATGLVSWTGLQGGIVRHTEVRGELNFLMPDETESGSHGESGIEHEHSGESGHSD